MRIGWSPLVILGLLVVSCGGGGAPGPVAREVSFAGGPEQSFLVVDGRTARELLEASDAAMVGARGRMVATASWGEETEVHEYTLAEAGPWITTQRVRGGAADGLLDIPSSFTRTTNVRYVGDGSFEGVEVWVIWYEFRIAGVEGPIEKWRTEWIAKGTLRILRQYEEDDDQLAGYDSIDRRFTYEN